MKIVLPICLIVISLNLFSQVGQTIIDTTKWENGRIKSIERYLTTEKYNGTDINNRHGLFLYFYKTGELQERRYYSHGDQDSILTDFYKNGNKKEEGFLNPCRIGTWTTWFENGSKQSEGKWDCNARVDKWRFWDSIGQLKNEVIFNDTFYLSTFYYYHPNRKLKSIEKFTGPHLISARMIEYKGGVKLDDGSYITSDFSGNYSGWPTGVWQIFNEQGILVEEDIYDR